MVDDTNYDESEDSVVDDDEARAAENGAVNDAESSKNLSDIAEAESLTVTAKHKKRSALEGEIAAFLAKGGRITEVPPDEHAE